ncbi:hypothetical protein J6590_049088 [Homalodisca vitripennis]|nr:hypothetical protein J6590_049088 [Homalodisca vitripennis]
MVAGKCRALSLIRTPGSRQPSPSDEELNKNNGVVVLENPHVSHHYPHPFPPPPHPHTLAHLDSHFEHVMTLDPSFEGPPTQQQPTQQQAAMDSPTVLSTSFDVQEHYYVGQFRIESEITEPPFLINSSTTNARYSPSQVMANTENGTYVATEQCPLYISTPTTTHAVACSNRGGFFAEPCSFRPTSFTLIIKISLSGKVV